MKEEQLFLRIEKTALVFSIAINIIVGSLRMVTIPYTVGYDTQFIYAFAKLIADGNIPYRDFNMLQTPLALYFMSLFFHISLDFRFIELAVFLSRLLVLYAMYKIMRMENVGREKALIVANLWSALSFCAIYSEFAMFFMLIAYRKYEQYHITSRPAYLFLASFSAFLCFWSKQNLGAVCIMMLFVCWAYHLVKDGSVKKSVKSAFVLCMSYLTMMLLTACILYHFGVWDAFLEYVVFGTADFANGYGRLECVLLFLLMLAVVIIGRCSKNFELTVLGFATLANVYPIFNEAHLYPGIIGLSILFICATKDFEIPKWNLSKQVVSLFLYTALIGFSIRYCMVPGLKLLQSLQCDFLGKPDVSYTASVSIERYEGRAVLDYIDNLSKAQINHCHFLSCNAGWYDIYLNRYDKYYDLFLKGNIGKQDPVELIKTTVQNDADSMFIVWTGSGKASIEGIEFQIPYEAYEYVMENYIRIDTIYNEDGNEIYGVYVSAKK